jgi:hypothetical protein
VNHQEHPRKGTAVGKTYQRNEFDTSALAVPEQVGVAMGEIADDMREGLLALAVGAGLQVMQTLMEADVTHPAGPPSLCLGTSQASERPHDDGAVLPADRDVARAAARAPTGEHHDGRAALEVDPADHAHQSHLRCYRSRMSRTVTVNSSDSLAVATSSRSTRTRRQ